MPAPSPMTSAPEPQRFVVAAVLDVPPGAVGAFQRYEAVVLPLLDRHGGRLERRLRNGDGTVEVHVISFASQAAYESYVHDPERLAHRAVLQGAEIASRVLESLVDVAPGLR